MGTKIVTSLLSATVVVLTVGWVASSGASAGTVMIPTALGGPVNVAVVSFKEARFQTIIKQQYDFSCGSAAVASLLTFHYSDGVSEMDVFTSMYDAGEQEKIQAYGFSLLDMKRYLERRGYSADGYRVGLDRLEAAGVPAIVLIDTNGYRHFVLIKGIRGDEVVVGDPALGVRILQRAEFEEKWNGIAFIVRSNVDTGRDHFNMAADWGVRTKAPFGNALHRQSLAAFTVHLTGSTNTF